MICGPFKNGILMGKHWEDPCSAEEDVSKQTLDSLSGQSSLFYCLSCLCSALEFFFLDLRFLFSLFMWSGLLVSLPSLGITLFGSASLGCEDFFYSHRLVFHLFIFGQVHGFLIIQLLKKLNRRLCYVLSS